MEKEKKRREADAVAAAEMIAKEALGQRSEGGSREDVAQTIPMELETVQARSLSLCIDPRAFFSPCNTFFIPDVFGRLLPTTALLL